MSDFTRIPDSDLIGEGLDGDDPPIGVIVRADLAKLVAQVRVAPDTPAWFAQAVEDCTRRYG